MSLNSYSFEIIYLKGFWLLASVTKGQVGNLTLGLQVEANKDFIDSRSVSFDVITELKGDG